MSRREHVPSLNEVSAFLPRARQVRSCFLKLINEPIEEPQMLDGYLTRNTEVFSSRAAQVSQSFRTENKGRKVAHSQCTRITSEVPTRQQEKRPLGPHSRVISRKENSRIIRPVHHDRSSRPATLRWNSTWSPDPRFHSPSPRETLQGRNHLDP